ncbi:GDSL esterase/lipase [Hordeum vulgare]|nr:GDSL esterase/lipase [Hordeum vulgare]
MAASRGGAARRERRAAGAGSAPAWRAAVSATAMRPGASARVRGLQPAYAMHNELKAEVGPSNANGAVFVAMNTRHMHANFTDGPKVYGFVTAKEACCGQGRFNGIGICTMVSSLCANRDQYLCSR